MKERRENRTLAALTTSLLPSWPALPGGEREVVERHVVEYIHTQIGRMPLYLRVPWTCVLIVFGLGPLLRYGRPFHGLSSTRRKAWINAWALSPLIPLRDFVKMVRSCALLAWFDHPTVTQALRAAEGVA